MRDVDGTDVGLAAACRQNRFGGRVTTPSMLDGMSAASRFELSWHIRSVTHVHGVLRTDERDLVHVDLRRLDLSLDLVFLDPSSAHVVGRCRWDRHHGAWGRAVVMTAAGDEVVHVVKDRPSWLQEPWHLETSTHVPLARFEESTGRSLLRRYLRLPSRWDLVGDNRVLARVAHARKFTAFAASIDITDAQLDAPDAERLLLGIVVRHARHLN